VTGRVDGSNGIARRMRRYWDDRARENAAFYVATTVTYDAPDLDKFFHAGDLIVREALLDSPVQPQGRVRALEIGSGLGRVCKALAPHFERVLGIDVSVEMVQRARNMVREPNVTFEVGDGMTLKAADDASVDFVITFTVLQHLPSRTVIAGYLREAARALRSGGVLAAQWNGDAHPLRYRLRCWRLRLQQRLGAVRDNRVAPEFLGTPVPVEYVCGVLRDVGLVIEATKGEGTLFSWVWARKP
jgi:SAM-dependent methyltransferase